MKAIVYEGVGRVSLKDVAKPKPKSNSVVVRVDSCAVCGTDVKAYTIGISSIKPPVILGHDPRGNLDKRRACGVLRDPVQWNRSWKPHKGTG